MSARTPFKPGAPPPAAAQQRPQPNADESAAFAAQRAQHGHGDDIEQADAPTRPLNTSSLKKLTNKKPPSRSAEHKSSVPKDAGHADNTIVSPRPRHPQTLFGQAAASSAPQPATSRASMLPPPPPVAFNAQARPPSRAAHMQRDASYSQMTAHNNRSNEFSHVSSASSQSLDYPEMSFLSADDEQHARSHELYADRARRNTDADSAYHDSPHGLEHGSKRYADHLDSPSDRPAKRARSIDIQEVHSALRATSSHILQMHFDRRGTSPLSDVAEVHGLQDAHYPVPPRRLREASVAPHDTAHPLHKILGATDLAAFAGDHAKQYEAEIAKWQSCSRADWEAHAGGAQSGCRRAPVCLNQLAVLAAKFSKLLDMVSWPPVHRLAIANPAQVKDHMG